MVMEQVNQIGSVTESIEAVKMSKRAGWGVMASHRRFDLEFHREYCYLIALTKSNKVPFSNIIYSILFQWRDWRYFHCWSLCGFGHGNYVLSSPYSETFVSYNPTSLIQWDVFLIIFCFIIRVKLRQELHAGQSVLQNITRLAFFVFAFTIGFCSYVTIILQFFVECVV